MITQVSIVNSGYNTTVMNVMYKGHKHLAKKFSINNVNFMNPNLFREICTTRKVKHKNIIANYGIVVDGWDVYILLERGDCGLVKLFINNVFDNNVDRKRLVLDVSDGLKYLHRNNINHCDLSPNNVVVINGVYKIIDFGNAIKGHRFDTYITPTPYIGTRDDPQHIKSDIWALGCMAHMVYFNRLPFYGTDKTSQLEEISRYIAERSDEDDVNINNIDHIRVNEMLEPDSTARKHIYFGEYCDTNNSLIDSCRDRYRYDVHISWKIKLIECIMSINLNYMRYENIYITLLNSYKLKSMSFQIYILNSICIFWLSFKLTTNYNIHISELGVWLASCRYTGDIRDNTLTDILKEIMMIINWDFDDKNILDCISIRGIDHETIRFDSLILYMDLSMCRMNEDKKYNQLVIYYYGNNHNRVSYNLSVILDKLDKIKPDFIINLQKFAKKTLNNICDIV